MSILGRKDHQHGNQQLLPDYRPEVGAACRDAGKKIIMLDNMK